MCGVCGGVDFERTDGSLQRTVSEMMELLRHRGPDGEGIWKEGPAVLGHRRLAIIDLEGGRQPLLSEDRGVGVVFNGEIYNFRDLRRSLRSRGHAFRTHCDTEVLVHGYEEWGEDIVPRLQGMFAFGIWDARRRRLFLARDRLGIKPLYYHATPGGARLTFASEIKALLADPGVPRRINRERLGEYLLYRSVSGPPTLFEGIREVEPGTMLSFSPDGRSERRYWTPEIGEDIAGRAVSPEPARRGLELLKESVTSRLLADVPLGTITSGGLDSSLVTVLAARAAGVPIDTFCVGFEDPRFDERAYARMVADQVGSRHHELVVTPDEIDEEIERLTWAHDEPLTHPNSVPMHLIFRHAKEEEKVTVLLSGEGADEVFGGYDWYRAMLRRSALLRWPGVRALAALVPGQRGRTARRVLDPGYPMEANAFAQTRELETLGLEPGVAREHRRRHWTASDRHADQLFIFDQKTYLLPLLQRQDRMSMAAGLEARVPFLDHRLVDWANALPASVKVRKGKTKALLREIASSVVPGEILERQKVGFSMPLAEWLGPSGALSHRVNALSRPGSVIHDWMDPAGVERLLTRHARNEENHGDLIWSLVALDAWAEVFLEGRLGGFDLPGAKTGRVPESRPSGPVIRPGSQVE